MNQSCPHCPLPLRGGDSLLEFSILMHAHAVGGMGVLCSKHGTQPAVQVHGPSRNPALFCRACWTDVYATAWAFIEAALPSLRDHANPWPSSPAGHAPGLPDFAAIQANVAAGLCWCGVGFIGVTYDQVAGAWRPALCLNGHAYKSFHAKPNGDQQPGGP